MPSQSQKGKAGETGLQGLGISMVAIGAGMVEAKPAVAISVILTGLACLYISVTIRNFSIRVKPSEVVEGIEQSLDTAEKYFEDESN